jgi:outer membrane protein
LPVLVFDSEHFYLGSYRAGLKLGPGEIFVKRRFEGFPSDRVPEAMIGTQKRSPGADIGIALSHRLGAGTAYGELMTDASDTSDGTELRLGYRYERWWSGNFRWRPYATLAWRDAKLNNYYYGVPGHEPGAGLDLTLGAIGAYRLSGGWQAIAGVELTRVSKGIADSPAVENGLYPSFTLGLQYAFTPQAAPPGSRKPLIVRAYKGASSDCDMMQIVLLRCTTTHTQDPTDVAALEIGQRLVERLNGWDVDIFGFVGLLQHQEKDLQPDFWQLQAYFKINWYGFPWSERVRTRIGYGTGIAYAGAIPFTEQRDQALRGRDTSKLLLYADPTVDFSLGDALGVRSLKETFLGIGVSHRSGIFGYSKLFNNTDGGSNYIYAFVESSF